MGMNILRRSCGTSTTTELDVNPNPLRWSELQVYQSRNACAVMVNYPNCTNFEGNKVLVLPGTWDDNRKELDPHFSDDNDSPLARFKPNRKGWLAAIAFSKTII